MTRVPLALLTMVLVVGTIHADEKPTPPTNPLLTGRTEVIAHRGGPGPDGTLAGIKRSMDRGVRFIELDVRLTKDGRAVILHDATVDRTTDGRGSVHEMTFEQVRALDAGVKYRDPDEPTKSFAGERIPTPEEVLKLVGDRGFVLLELKVPDALSATARAVVDAKAQRRAIIRSSEAAVLRKAKQIDPFILTGAMLKRPKGEAGLLVKQLTDIAVSAWTPGTNDELDADVIAAVRRAGIAAWATNTNDEAGLRRAAELGPEGIITDRPWELQKLLKERRK